MNTTLDARRLGTELLGTALLVFFAVGTATLSFGFKLTGGSTSAGVVTTALAFGLVLLALVYAIGPVSGCHVNPAVTVGFLVSKRMALGEALGYLVAQFLGAHHRRSRAVGRRAGLSPVFEIRGRARHQRLGQELPDPPRCRGRVRAEVVLTFLFVLVVLAATSHVRRRASPAWPSAWPWPSCTWSASRSPARR